MKYPLTTIYLTLALSLGTLSSAWSADFQKGLAAAKSGDYATALRILSPLAKQGDARAQYNLGVMLERGMGVPRDSEGAVQWWILATKQGNVPSMRNLAGMLYEGKGVKEDKKFAIKLWTLAAEQGDDFAKRMLKEHGESVTQTPGSQTRVPQKARQTRERVSSCALLKHKGKFYKKDSRNRNVLFTGFAEKTSGWCETSFNGDFNGYIKDGKFHGEITWRNQEGLAYMHGTFREGVLHGTFSHYATPYNSEKCCGHGRDNCKTAHWGALRNLPLCEDIPRGSALNVLMDEAQYVNGKRHGTHKSYRFRAGSDGDLSVRMLSRTAKYEHGKLNGIVKSYCGGSTPYPGSLSVWEFYVNGQVRERSCMTADGFEDKCTRYQTQGETTEDWNGNEKPYSTGISRCSSSQ